MPASRIVFALNDLIEEIGRLTPDAESLTGSLLLDREAYSAVKREMASHFGWSLVADDPKNADPYSFKFKGFTVTMRAGE